MVKIISDSTCDLSKDLLEKYDIDIVPLHIVLGEKEYEDGVSVTPDEIYKWSDENKVTPKTSAAGIERTIEMLRPYVEAGVEVVCFSISSMMSTTVNAMKMAAEVLEAEHLVTVIDSANLSTGIGLLVIEATIMAREGKTAQAIAERIEELKPLVKASFVVDTLTYLHRGGRCSGLAAMAGGVFKLHPKIVVENGKMRPDKKYRGKIERVVIEYTRDMEEELKNAKKDRVFITHSGCGEDIIAEVKDYLKALNVFDEILVTRAGGVISSHCGPGTLGVLFISND